MKQIYSILFIFIGLLSFAQLTPPAQLQAYYSDVDFSQTQMELFNDLATTTIAKQSNFLSYTPDVWNASKITDEDPLVSSNVLLIYGYDDSDNNHVTDRTRNKNLNGGNTGTDWNREHTFPNSLAVPNLDTNGRDATPFSDAHNLRPSDVQMNNDRGNRKYTTGSGNAGQSASFFYPGDEWKGDAARIILYMYLRYGDQCRPTYAVNGTVNSVDPNMINLLLEWNAEDPVSAIEDARNLYHANTSNADAQGNRNPFIDNPFLATVIWGGTQAENRWGDNPPEDTQAPTTPTNLIASNETTTTVDLNWTASTDDTGVTTYNIFVDGVYYVSTNSSTPSITVSGLSSDTTYSFAITAADLANNESALSDSINATTLESNTGDGCAFETFETIPASNSSYSDRSWTGQDGGIWTAARARTDQTLNNRAIAIDVRDDKNGAITSSTIAGGIGSLTATTQRAFSGGTGTLQVRVNDNVLASLPYGADAITTTISDINVAGDIQITIFENTPGGDRVIIDDLSWTCYDPLSLNDDILNQLTMFPNPAKGRVNISFAQPIETKIEIYNILGKRVFITKINESKSIDVSSLNSGFYLVKFIQRDKIKTKKLIIGN